MPSPGPHNTQQPTPTTLPVDNLRAPNIETLARDALKTRIEDIVRDGIQKLNTNLDKPDLTLTIKGRPVQTDGKVAEGFEAIMGIEKARISAPEREERLSALIKEKTAALVARAPIIVADYTHHLTSFGVAIANNPGDPGLSPTATKAAAENYLSTRLSEEVEKCIRDKTSQLLTQEVSKERRLNAERTKFFGKLLNDPNFNLDEWIDRSGLKNPSTPEEEKKFNEELAKLRKVGVWSDPDASPAQNSKYMVAPSYFRTCRLAMNLSWGVTVGTIATLAITAPVALVFWAPVTTLINVGVQKLGQFLHDRKFDAMFSEINRELKNAGPMEAGIAWAGVLHKFLTDYKPLLLAPNRTNFWNNHESMSMDAVLRQLRQAAEYGAESIEKRDISDQKQTFFKDSKFNDYIAQNDDAMKAIEKRWKHFTKNSKNAAKIGLGAGVAAPFGLFAF